MEIAIETHKRLEFLWKTIRRLGKMLARRKDGIASIVVELFLVIVTLVASIALSGFLFSTMGFLSHPAEVTASQAYCISTGANETCSVELVNVGSGVTSTSTVCTLSGASGQVTFAGVVPAGGSRVVSCKVVGVSLSAGEIVSGSIPLSNGGTVYFESRT